MRVSRANFSLGLIGAVLASITSGAVAYGRETATIEDQQAAIVIADMLDHGHVMVDPKTGSIFLKRSVLSILKHYGKVKKDKVRELEATGGGSSTSLTDTITAE